MEPKDYIAILSLAISTVVSVVTYFSRKDMTRFEAKLTSEQKREDKLLEYLWSRRSKVCEARIALAKAHMSNAAMAFCGKSVPPPADVIQQTISSFDIGGKLHSLLDDIEHELATEPAKQLRSIANVAGQIMEKEAESPLALDNLDALCKRLWQWRETLDSKRLEAIRILDIQIGIAHNELLNQNKTNNDCKEAKVIVVH